jgi:hypothetical protein
LRYPFAPGFAAHDCLHGRGVALSSPQHAAYLGGYQSKSAAFTALVAVMAGFARSGVSGGVVAPSAGIMKSRKVAQGGCNLRLMALGTAGALRTCCTVGISDAR